MGRLGVLMLTALLDRSRSRDRSADNTRDHSVGVTTND
jgi:hypothetical protein